jgi:hypothetical protein
MVTRGRSSLLVLVAVLLAGWGLAAAEGAAAATGYVRVVYGVNDGPKVDVYLAGKKTASNVARATVVPYALVATGTRAFAIRRAGSPKTSAPIASGTFPVKANKVTTVVATGFLRKINVKARAYTSREATTAPTDVTRVRVFQLSPDAPVFDVFLGATTGKAFDSGRGYPKENGYHATRAVVRGASFFLTLHGKRQAIRSLKNRTLGEGKPYTLYVLGAWGPRTGEQRLVLKLVDDSLPVS